MAFWPLRKPTASEIEPVASRLWPRFSAQWTSNLGGPAPVEAFESVYVPLSLWLLERVRAHPKPLFLFGIQGSIGRGKSVFAQALAGLLNAQLAADEGRCVAQSIDDYYLTKAERDRPAFRARGYNPPGISNRGPAGTHELVLLQRALDAFEANRPGAAVALPRFDKQADDRFPEPTIVTGRVRIFLLDGWFLGCRTDGGDVFRKFGFSVGKTELPKYVPSLKRSVAKALPAYTPLFNRIDCLWAFAPEPVESIVRQRLRQQETLDRRSGRAGMTPEQVSRFVQYFYVDAWQPPLTSPWPPEAAVDFRAELDDAYRFRRITARPMSL